MSTPQRPAMATTHTLIVLTDEAADSQVTIAPARGAIVTSFKVGGRELLYLDRATFDDPAANVRGGIPVLFPSPGKLANDSWHDASGRAYTMKQHGFARTLPWTVEAVAEASTSLLLVSNDETLAQYPAHFNAMLHVALEGTALRLSMQIHNTGEQPMQFGLGYHPYFLVADKSRARIDTDATQVFDNVTKRSERFEGFDFSRPEVDLHLLNQSTTSGTLRLTDRTKITVSGSEDFTHWVVWSVAGKPYVCLEPWTSMGNALNTGEKLVALAGGESHHASVEIRYDSQ